MTQPYNRTPSRGGATAMGAPGAGHLLHKYNLLNSTTNTTNNHQGRRLGSNGGQISTLNNNDISDIMNTGNGFTPYKKAQRVSDSNQNYMNENTESKMRLQT